MRRTGLLSYPLVFALGFGVSVPSRAATIVGSRQSGSSSSMGTRDAAVRVVGPKGESVPVLNEGGMMPLQLKVIDRSNATVSASGWHSGSTDVATVDTTGKVRPVKTGFATIYAETAQGEAKCFAAVMRVTPQNGATVRGDTKGDTSGRLYLSDPVHHVIVRQAGLQTDRQWAGTTDGAGFADGNGSEARFNEPTGLSVDVSAQGGLYVADTLNHCIRKIDFDGRVGGEHRSSVVVGHAGVPGTMAGDGPFPLDQMTLDGPEGVVSAGGNLLVADTRNHCIWSVDVARGEVRLAAGKAGEAGLEDGMGGEARFSSPSGLAINTRGTLLAVADTGNDVVRLIRIGRDARGETQYRVATLGVASSGKVADVERVAASADTLLDAIGFDAPRAVSIDGVENVYVIDARTATVVSRPEGANPQLVSLAQEGTFGRAVSLAIERNRASVLDAGATDDEAVKVVEIGAPQISSLSLDTDGQPGGAEILLRGSNFAPETELTLGDGVVTDFTVESATSIRFRVPPQAGFGGRTLSVRTRGGTAQRAFNIRPPLLDEIADGAITTVAGGGLTFVGDGGSAVAPGVGVDPTALAVDGAGNLMIVDRFNDRIRRVDAATGVITTMAGSGQVGFGGDGGPATSAALANPEDIAVDGSGGLLVADSWNNRVRRVDLTTGMITTVAGNGSLAVSGDGGPALSAGIASPVSLAVDRAGNVFLGSLVRNDVGSVVGATIRRVDAPTGVITLVTTIDAFVAKTRGIILPQFTFDIAVGDDGLFVADNYSRTVRRFDPTTGDATVVAGGGDAPLEDGVPATSVGLYPDKIEVDGARGLLVCNGSLLLRVDLESGTIARVAGNRSCEFQGDGGPARRASVCPAAVAVDGGANMFVADSLRVRRIDAATGRIATVAGTGIVRPSGDLGPATSADVKSNDVRALASAGGGSVYFTEAGRGCDPGISLDLNTVFGRVRHIELRTRAILTDAGVDAFRVSGDNGPARNAAIGCPTGIGFDAVGNLFIAEIDNGGSRIRKLDLQTGVIVTVAGGGDGFERDGVPGTSAILNFTGPLTVDGRGNVFFGDLTKVWKLDAATGTLTTVAGKRRSGFGGDGGPASRASLNNPSGLAFDRAGNLYIADTQNGRIRRVSARTGRIRTIAGDGRNQSDGDGGPALEAGLGNPVDVVVDGAGNLYFVSISSATVRRVDARTGVITTVAGRVSPDGYTPDTGDGLPATEAGLGGPRGLAIDERGNLYIGTYERVRVVKGIAIPWPKR